MSHDAPTMKPSRSSSALLFALGVVLLASPALAKDKVAAAPAEMAAMAAADAHDLCQAILDQNGDELDRFTGEGWTHESGDHTLNGPYFEDVSADRDYEGLGSASVWAVHETYFDHELGYCSFEIDDPAAPIGIGAFANMPGFKGNVEISGQNAFGSWRKVEGPATTLILATKNADRFFYQVTIISDLSAN